MADKLRGGSTVGGYTIWHKGNSGTDSGLDADLLDGLDSTQFLRSDISGTLDGDFTATGDITANSDKRLKENIEIIPEALEKIMELRGVTFTRNDLKDTELRMTGVIAQEVQKVLPEAVKTNENGILSVAYGNIIGLLIEGIKEQNIKINEMQIEINNLKRSL